MHNLVAINISKLICMICIFSNCNFSNFYSNMSSVNKLRLEWQFENVRFLYIIIYNFKLL